MNLNLAFEQGRVAILFNEIGAKFSWIFGPVAGCDGCGRRSGCGCRCWCSRCIARAAQNRAERTRVLAHDAVGATAPLHAALAWIEFAIAGFWRCIASVAEDRAIQPHIFADLRIIAACVRVRAIFEVWGPIAKFRCSTSCSLCCSCERWASIAKNLAIHLQRCSEQRVRALISIKGCAPFWFRDAIAFWDCFRRCGGGGGGDNARIAKRGAPFLEPIPTNGVVAKRAL